MLKVVPHTLATHNQFQSADVPNDRATIEWKFIFFELYDQISTI